GALAMTPWAVEGAGAALLGERAALFGYGRGGRVSPSRSCRLLPATDGWLAVNLARPDDLRFLPAWLGEGDTGDPWRFVAERVACRSLGELVETASLLGLAVAEAGPAPDPTPPWYRLAASGPRTERRAADRPLVADLSSLWAGPLCAELLALCGARVVKVESSARPDGARAGSRLFFDLLNGSKRSLVLDLDSERGRAALRKLLERADIVVESSRPRALEQLGVDARELVATRPGLSWVSITGYGRSGKEANRVAFGDDAAAAAGLASVTGRYRGEKGPLFCGDAIADPLTGMHAAVAAMASWMQGGGQLLDVSMRDVVARVLAFRSPVEEGVVERCHQARRGNSHQDWEVVVGGQRQIVAPPHARKPLRAARPLGADTASLLRNLRC
ncbi:MAG: CoA transferase, partial [Myxococcota bacterium]